MIVRPQPTLLLGRLRLGAAPRRAGYSTLRMTQTGVVAASLLASATVTMWS